VGVPYTGQDRIAGAREVQHKVGVARVVEYPCNEALKHFHIRARVGTTSVGGKKVPVARGQLQEVRFTTAAGKDQHRRPSTHTSTGCGVIERKFKAAEWMTRHMTTTVCFKIQVAFKVIHIQVGVWALEDSGIHSQVTPLHNVLSAARIVDHHISRRALKTKIVRLKKFYVSHTRAVIYLSSRVVEYCMFGKKSEDNHSRVNHHKHIVRWGTRSAAASTISIQQGRHVSSRDFNVLTRHTTVALNSRIGQAGCRLHKTLKIEIRVTRSDVQTRNKVLYGHCRASIKYS
jgi:hypothetical protein